MKLTFESILYLNKRIRPYLLDPIINKERNTTIFKHLIKSRTTNMHMKVGRAS